MMLAREGVAALASPARRAKTLDTGSGPKSFWVICFKNACEFWLGAPYLLEQADDLSD